MASPGGPGPAGSAATAARRKWRSWKWLVLAAVALAAVPLLATWVAELTGPAGIAPTRSMVIGTWRSTSGAALVLRPDGTFTARSLPADFGGPFSGAPAQGSGTWHLPPAGSPGSVVFDFSSLPHAEFQLGVERLGSTVVLYYDKGDPDQGVTGQYQFTKVPPG